MAKEIEGEGAEATTLDIISERAKQNTPEENKKLYDAYQAYQEKTLEKATRYILEETKSPDSQLKRIEIFNEQMMEELRHYEKAKQAIRDSGNFPQEESKE